MYKSFIRAIYSDTNGPDTLSTAPFGPSKGTIEEDVYGALFASRQNADKAAHRETLEEHMASKKARVAVAAASGVVDAIGADSVALGVAGPSSMQRPAQLVDTNPRPAKQMKRTAPAEDPDDECVVTRVVHASTPSAPASHASLQTNPRDRHARQGSLAARASPQPMQQADVADDGSGDGGGGGEVITEACPVCGKQLEDSNGKPMDNAQVNQHIDSCLSGFA